MPARAAFRDGLTRVNGAPVMLGGMYAVTLLAALPLAYVLSGTIAAHLGSSLAAEGAARGTSYEWWQEFTAQAEGLAKTFTPSIAGFGAVLDNLEGILDNVPLASSIAAVTAVWLAVWSFLSGGVIDRLARRRPTRPHGFFAACGVHFWRLLRLGVLAWLVYACLFRYVHGWIFARALGALTHDVGVERTAFLYRVAGYLLFGALLVACNIVFDYARVRIVVEDRRSAIGALLAGGRFVRRHVGAAIGLYTLNALAFLVLIAVYAAIAPGAPGAGWRAGAALAIGQAYIVARVYLKLLFYASETALFQGALAHAAYTAAPAVLWPDSPAAESIVGAERSRPA
ncbi:MAG: hypothetical protein M3545_02960 [Acidobacteriota bacterium]|nr:hypothetical protein [Acidobacteriota bacterium]